MPVELEVGNRLTIPLNMRRLLGIQENDCLYYRVENEKIILTKEKETGYPIKVRKLFRITFPKTFRDTYNIKTKDKFYIEAIDGAIIIQRLEDKKQDITCFYY